MLRAPTAVEVPVSLGLRCSRVRDNKRNSRNARRRKRGERVVKEKRKNTYICTHLFDIVVEWHVIFNWNSIARQVRLSLVWVEQGCYRAEREREREREKEREKEKEKEREREGAGKKAGQKIKDFGKRVKKRGRDISSLAPLQFLIFLFKSKWLDRVATVITRDI